MKKLFQFLKSMTFGMILLGLMAGVSVIGSVIPQNNAAMYYVSAYPKAYQWILKLQLDRVFTSWYFILIVVLLCMNLILCSVIRFRRINEENILEGALQAKEEVILDEEGMRLLKQELDRRKYQVKTENNVSVYHKNGFGRYGTFITHIGILLTVIFFALGMITPRILDETCMPKESIVLEDGTEIYVDSFSITDVTGKLDFKSRINIKLANGKESGLTEISVNHPASLGQYKTYQQTYGTKGKIRVMDQEGHQDEFYVESQDFLSADGKNGILIDNLYPGLVETENGTQLITSTSGRYENPVYVFLLMEDGKQSSMLAFPGDSLEVAGYTYVFEDPVEYPGLRIKKAPAMINWLLLASVLILTFGLAVTFLTPPEVITVTEKGYRILGQKSEGLRLHLSAVLSDHVIEGEKANA